MKSHFIILSILFIGLNVFAQSDDPQSIYYNQTYALNPGQSFMDNPLFANVNLTLNANPQNEPSVRISRFNPNIVVAAWRDFRLGYNPAIRRIGYAYSSNGGNSWSAPQLLPDPMPNHATQSDPVLVNDGNGIIYLTSTSRDPSNTTGQTVVYRSTNNGVTFTEWATAAASGEFEDKEWITCDLNSGSPSYNYLYITWTRIGIGIRFIRSTDGGATWTPTAVVVGDNAAGQGSNVAVGTNSNIYVVWGQSGGIKFDKSTNAGVSFGTDYALSTNPNQIGFPFICVDYSSTGSRGNVYVVWDDNRNGTYDVWFQRSTNAGASWLAAPVRVNDAVTNNQYKPAISCDENGMLHVVYYDERGAVGQVNSYYAYSSDHGDTWTNARVSDSSFTITSVNSDVRNGEYIGIDAFGGKVIPIWTDDRSGSPNQEVYISNNIIVSVPVSGGTIPETFALQQNFPNPFNPSTDIMYSVPNRSFVNLEVYDVLGNHIRTLVNKDMEAGSYRVRFDALSLAGGIYFYTLSANGLRDTKKMVLVK